MTVPIDAAQLDRFRAIVRRWLGLQIEDSRLGCLEEALKRRLAVTRSDAGTYLSRVESQMSSDERGALAQDLVITETYFFRNIAQFHALREQVLPERVRARGAARRLRVLSAGCASGEEAYSIAMTLHGLLPDASWALEIDAIDVNPAMIDKAKRGRYTLWSLRETSPAMRQRWFRSEGSELVLDDAIRAAVRFEEGNLNDDSLPCSASGYDAVMCRNVLMYFSPSAARDAVARLTRSLAPGGYLFLGHAETLRGLSQDYHLRHTHGTFYYQRSDAAIDMRPAEPAQPLAAAVEGPALTAAVEGADCWVQAVSRAADRIQALGVQASKLQSPAAPRAVDGRQLAGALDLLRQERFAEALEQVEALPAGSMRDPEALLLHAVLLVHGGRIAQAEETCRRLLSIDELNAGAYYVLALCREGEADARGASEHDQIAAYLDPSFAMPRLHLGLLARRAGDHATQRRQLGLALELLQREDSSRLLLFGGGFSRDALLALCRAELRSCEGVA